MIRCGNSTENWGFVTDLDSRDTNREACSCFLLPLIDELEQPGDGTWNYTQSLKRVVTANHRVWFSWVRWRTKKLSRGRVYRRWRFIKRHIIIKKKREKESVSLRCFSFECLSFQSCLFYFLQDDDHPSPTPVLAVRYSRSNAHLNKAICHS